MEKLANLTQTDVNNGALIRMLAGVGIPDVQEYVKQFHQETEGLIVEEFEHPDQNTADNDEQIVPPADIQSWLTSLRPQLHDPIRAPLSIPQQKQEQPPIGIRNTIASLRPVLHDSAHVNSTEQQSEHQQQQLPGDVQGWITGLRPRLDDPIQPPIPEPQQQKQPPTDLKGWMQRMAPDNSHPLTDVTSSETTTSAHNNNTDVEGNLSTSLLNWSKSLGEQPPPASLDAWLQGLVPKNMHESIGKANSSKTRLNSYLNAAQEVLSQHGYNVSTEIKPTAVATKTGMFGNVKQMYFLWKVLDKNNDRKITVEDVQIMLQEMGFGFLSKVAAQSLFDMVDANHDGELQFRDFIALMGIIKQLVGAIGSVKA